MGLYENENDICEEHIKRLLIVFGRIHTKSVWSKVKNPKDFTVKRFKEGYMNDICACILTDEARNRLSSTRDDPAGVVVKFFPKNGFIPIDSVKRAIIYSTISIAGFGPVLIYMDDECCVNEFLMDAREHQYEEDFNEELCEELFRKLANFHHLNVPVSFPLSNWNDCLLSFRDNFPGVKDVLNGKLFELLDDHSAFSHYKQTFKEIEFENMLNYFLKVAPKIGSPINFCHMDFHRTNRLITNRIMPDCQSLREYYFIDFDTVMYSYRGFDFGAFFYTFKMEEYGEVKIASDEEMQKLIEVYRQECSKICGEQYLLDEKNSVQNILQEAKFFMMYYFFLCDLFHAAMFCQNSQKARNREFLQNVYNRHFAVKELFKKYKKEGILPDA